MAAKPPLPPRSASSLSPIDISSPGSWEEQHSPQFLSPVVSPTIKNSPYPGGLHDPRSSSTQSLRPAEPAGNDRRTLLIVYIHGFLGDETSFKSFPAHVHAILTKSLRETHVAYTKIYPRYKSRKNISFATNDFSKWYVLKPENAKTATDSVLGLLLVNPIRLMLYLSAIALVGYLRLKSSSYPPTPQAAMESLGIAF